MVTYKLSDIIEIIHKGQKALFGGFYFWFHAEIHKITDINDRYHMELVEIDKSNLLVAKMKAIIFDKKTVDSFVQKTGLKPAQREGMTLLMEGSINFHKDYGASIIVKNISSEFTHGNILQQKTNILTQLDSLGIRNHNISLQRGMPPYHIALITGEQSQGANDFVSILQQSGYAFNITNYPCAIHGNQAKQDVLEQLQKVNHEHQQGANFSHIAIVRGGGESSGMLRQNDADIAIQICKMPIPVILAVGHTNDITVLDQIVHTPAKTPSNAAHMLVDSVHEYTSLVDSFYNDIQKNIGYKINMIGVNLEHYHQLIRENVVRICDKLSNNVQQRYTLISSQSPDKIKEKGYGIVKYQNEYISKKNLDKLQKGDTLTIDIYDRTITVTIQDIG